MKKFISVEWIQAVRNLYHVKWWKTDSPLTWGKRQKDIDSNSSSTLKFLSLVSSCLPQSLIWWYLGHFKMSRTMECNNGTEGVWSLDYSSSWIAKDMAVAYEFTEKENPTLGLKGRNQ